MGTHICGTKMYSPQYTTWLGKFACHVTSKILGIGAAEHNWGEVKHLKTDKQFHLGVSVQISKLLFLVLIVQSKLKLHGQQCIMAMRLKTISCFGMMATLMMLLVLMMKHTSN